MQTPHYHFLQQFYSLQILVIFLLFKDSAKPRFSASALTRLKSFARSWLEQKGNCGLDLVDEEERLVDIVSVYPYRFSRPQPHHRRVFWLI